MKREEQIKEMAKIKASHITSDKDMQVAFADALRAGAMWADSHPRWISVEEELPKEYVKVLAYTDVYGIIIAWKGDDADNWYTRDDREPNGSSGCRYLGYQVTHWLPLPSLDHIADASKKVEKGGEE